MKIEKIKRIVLIAMICSTMCFIANIITWIIMGIRTVLLACVVTSFLSSVSSSVLFLIMTKKHKKQE